MKNKLWFTAIIITIAALLFSTCNKKTTADPSMTLTTGQDVSETTIFLAGEGRATIDWEDGMVIKPDELEEFNSYTWEGIWNNS